MKVVIILLALVSIQFGNTPDNMKGMVERHNFWRNAVGVSPLTWSDKLARVAQGWANNQAKRNCGCSHSPDRKYGENIYCSEGMDNTAADVVDDWAEEIKFYNAVNGKCKGGVCGHYTQLVWRRTTQVGCGMARCGEKEIWVCNYDPPGNYVNEKAY